MIRSSDLHTYAFSTQLEGAGTALIAYEVRRCDNLRNLHSTLAYLVRCTQRIIIPNSTPYPVGPQNVTAFDDYPAILTSTLQITNSGELLQLLSYSPKTINASVATSMVHDNGTSSSTSHQHSSGSTTSQSNSYGASVSLGFFGDALTGGVSASYDHTTSSSASQSTGTEQGVGQSTGSSASDTMSVKDWACYSYLDSDGVSPTWVWGQEYPWNVVQWNNANVSVPTSDSSILLPSFVEPLLTDGVQALPPSQISLFGLDFTMTSLWRVEPSNNCLISVNQSLQYCVASHIFVPGAGDQPATVSATLSEPETFTIPAQTIDLCAFGLDPLPDAASRNAGTAIGFIPSKFIMLPAPYSSNTGATNFKIVSTTNDLLITDTTAYSGLTPDDVGAGFAASETSLSATFTKNCSTLRLKINFKVVDATSNYSFYMKHWKSNNTGVKLQITINGDSANVITKHVDAFEAEGGESNLLGIALRNLDYGSVDYSDYLRLGFNSIDIDITPIDGKFADSGYQIRAVAIEIT